MKIAIVYHYFAHYRGPIIEELLYNSEFDFYFIGDVKAKKGFENLKLYNFENDKIIKVNNIWFGKYFLWQNRLLRILNNNKFDAVIFLGDWKFLSTWLAIFFLRFKKTPTLFWSHGLLDNQNSINDKLKLFFLSLFSHGGFVYSYSAKKIMLSKGFNKKIDIIYNSLNYKKQIEIIKKNRSKKHFQPKTQYKSFIVFSGRLDKRKNIQLLFDCIKLLKERKEFISLVLIGDGDYKEQLILYAKKLNIEKHILFYGSCYDEETLASFYLNAFACVIPNAVGLTAIHSLTYGVPVITNNDITSHGPEIESVIEMKTGLYFEKNNMYSLAEKIEYLKNMSIEDRLYFKLQCQKIITEKYNPKAQLSIILKRINEIV